MFVTHNCNSIAQRLPLRNSSILVHFTVTSTISLPNARHFRRKIEMEESKDENNAENEPNAAEKLINAEDETRSPLQILS